MVIGGVLAAVHAVHGVSEINEEPLAFLSGVVLPLAVSLAIAGGGYRLGRREWSGFNSRRAVGWCLGGTVVGIGLAGLLVGYQAAHGVALDDTLFVLAIHATYGAALGLVLATYDLRVRTARDRLRQESERLDQFASVVSHDLRNPLNVAQGHLDLARETGDGTHFDAVEGAHRRMETIIRDTLALARQGEESLSPEPVAVSEVAAAAWELIDTGDADLEVDTDLRIRADPGQVETLLQNLLRNAVEHNADPVTARVGDLDDGEGFYVEDTGTGIPEDRRERVLETGYTTGDDRTGLGLAIVQSIVDAHGWSLALDESDEGGARLEVRGVGTSG